MAKNKSPQNVLGVSVNSRLVQAVLLRATPEGTQLVRRFTRQRASTDRVGDGANLPGMGNEFSEVQEGEDYSVQFGEGSSDSGSLFLESEFGKVEGGGNGAMPAAQASLFTLELNDILAECRDAGYDDIPMAFSLSASDTEQVILQLPGDAANEGASRSKLLARLEDEHPTPFDKESVAFLPMTRDGDESVRYLALIPRPSEPIVPTLKYMQKDRRHPLPVVPFIDTELSVYLGLARATHKNVTEDEEMLGDPNGDIVPTTLVVRASDEDTLVFFLKGDNLHHAENLRSLTAFDAPETICSRVLLLQDEYEIGEINRVLVASDEDEDLLIDSFGTFFPDASVRSMQTTLPAPPKGAEVPDSLPAAAMAAALRLADDRRYNLAFEKVNLLPKGVLKRKLKMPIAWQSIAALVLLFVTVLFFTWRFVSNEQHIAAKKQELRTFTTKMAAVNAQDLQTDIDSLNNQTQSIMTALETLDELLIGSDRWSRALATSSRHVGAVGSIWVDSWQPGGTELKLEGNSTSRDRVVNLAQRLDASIMSLTFTEIREWPVYSFTMNVPLPEELPEAAMYLRAQSDQSQADRENTAEGQPQQVQASQHTTKSERSQSTPTRAASYSPESGR